MNRPQFFFSTPKGFEDEPYVRPVSPGQDTNGLIPAGEYLNDYVVQLDNDAPQLFRSLFWQGIQQGQGTDVAGSLLVRMRDAYGNFLTDGYIPLWLWAWGAGSNPPDGGSGRAKVFEPELFCEPGSVLIFDFYNSGSSAAAIPPYLAPVLMSPIHSAVQMETFPVGGAGQGSGVISFGGNLYQVLQFTGLVGAFPAGIGSVNVFRSADGGLTWSILDGANSPTNGHIHSDPSGGLYYNGAGLLTVVTTAGTSTDAFAAPVSIRNFDLSTGLWGAAYGAGSGNCYGVNQCYLRSDGSLLVVALDGILPNHLSAFVLAGGAWSSFDLETSFPGGWVSNGSSSTVYDPATGTIHMFGVAKVGLVSHQYYQQLVLANAVAEFQNLSGVYGAASAMGQPLIYGGQLVWGVMDSTLSFSTILLGTPLAAPVFSVAGYPGVFPGQPNPSPFPNTLQASLATDGTTLWSVFLGDGTSDIVYLSLTRNLANPLAGWAGAIIFNDPTQTILNGIQYPSISIGPNGSPLITVQGKEAPGPGEPTNFYFSPAGAPGGAGIFPGLFELRGVKRSQGCSIQ